jgi:hypothetical protein
VNQKQDGLAGGGFVPFRQQKVANGFLWNTLDGGRAERLKLTLHEIAQLIHIGFAAGKRFIIDQRR